MVALDDIAEPSDPRAADGGPESRDRNRAVRRAVFALPSKCREALVLSYFHGMDVAPLRKASACPEGTVKARLSRGREILRNKLQQILRTPRLKEEEAR